MELHVGEIILTLLSQAKIHLTPLEWRMLSIRGRRHICDCFATGLDQHHLLSVYLQCDRVSVCLTWSSAVSLKRDLSLKSRCDPLLIFLNAFFFFLPVKAQRPNSLSVTAAGELGLWTSQGDAQVKLRMGDTGLAAETPLTVNQMFTSAVERFGDCLALSWKEGEQQKTLNYRNYYESCRTAAKSFLKVGFDLLVNRA